MWQIPLFTLHKLISRRLRLSKRALRSTLPKKPRQPRKHTYATELYDIWYRVALSYFPDRQDLLEYKLRWSTRPQKRVLGSCHLKKREVIVARELNHPDYTELLEPLIYHEMCHAIFGLTPAVRQGKRQWHGREFRTLERQHPKIDYLDRWIKSGGWLLAVRRDRGRRAALKRGGNGVRSE